MVRTQLYLPDQMYKELKKEAKAKGMTFAAYVRVHLEERNALEIVDQRELKDKYPILKWSGVVGSDSPMNNKELDRKIYGF